MPFTKLTFRPGVNQEITSYANEGGWRDCDKIRFRFGYPEKLGGWEKSTNNNYLGTARGLHSWVALDGASFLGVGTHKKYYIEEGGKFNDVTPVRSRATGGSSGTTAFAATNGSTTIVVSDVEHGAAAGDFVEYSGASSLGGNITAAILNIEYEIDEIIDANSYKITASVAANSSDTSDGGGSVVAGYQLNVGLDTQIGGNGWGAGLYGGITNAAVTTTLNGAINNSVTTLTLTSGTNFPNSGTVLINEELITYSGKSTNDLTGLTRGTSGTDAAAHSDGDTVRLAVGNTDSDDDFTGWGDASAVNITNELRLWSHDNFGEDLLINPRDSGLFYWDKSSDTLTGRAKQVGPSGDLGASTGLASGTKKSVPQISKQIIISDQNKHTICFGADGLGADANAIQGDGIQDPLLIRFSEQESIIDWFPTDTNTAGTLRLGQGSEFVQAIETKREILVWTDTALMSLRFIGPPFTFGLQPLAPNVTIRGPNAAVSAGDIVYWMGKDNFYLYSGQTQQIPCTVRDKVFLDFNDDQSDKVFGGLNSEFSEVFWFYPSSGSDENDRYVVYNYADNLWYFGILARTAWLDRGTRLFPQAAGKDNNISYIYNHEIGNDDDGEAMTSFIESAAVDIGDGDQFTYIRRIIPDLTFSGSTALSSPQATLTFKSRDYPGGAFESTDSGAVSRTATSPVETFTNTIDLRARGRSFTFRVDSDSLGTKWKLGSPRIDVKTDGRR